MELKRRDFVKTVGLGAASLAVAGCVKGGGPPARKPNFIFILIDDLGWKDAGFMGSSYYETPNIDRLAGEGMIFTDAYASAPNCAPSRASFLTGLYSPRHRIFTVNSSERGKARDRRLIPTPNTTDLDPGFVTIAEVLKGAGYETAHVGKWHLGEGEEFGPLNQGFDINIGGNRMGHPGSYFSPYGVENLQDGPEGEYLTDRLTNEALRFIEEHREGPFFLYLSHYAVHTPIQAKEEMVGKYRGKEGEGGQSNAAYAAMVESMDRGVGRVMEKLTELDLEEDTVVFFFSDNGGHGVMTSMDPLRGSKGMLYEGGIRSPMIVRWPGRVEAGASCSVPVIIIDFYPTIAEMAGAELPGEQPVDGLSVVPLLNGRDRVRRDSLFWHFPAYLERYSGMESPWRTTPAGAIRHGDWKLIEFFEDGRLELYNLKDDIGEQNNLAEDVPRKRDELHRLLIEWRESVDAPVPTELNPVYDPGL